MVQKTSILSFFCILAFSTLAQADPWFVNPYRVIPDAYKLQHASAKFASKLGTYNANKSLRTESLILKEASERLTAAARRNSSRYAIFSELDRVKKSYQSVKRRLASTDILRKHRDLELAWEDLQQSYDNFYYDIYGYDLYDPYFTQHPDFTASFPTQRYRSRNYYRYPAIEQPPLLPIPYKTVPQTPVAPPVAPNTPPSSTARQF